jgi:hypothetical protein
VVILEFIKGWYYSHPRYKSLGQKSLINFKWSYQQAAKSPGDKLSTKLRQFHGWVTNVSMQSCFLKIPAVALLGAVGLAIVQTVWAEQEMRYPGFMWGQIRYPSDVFDEDDNSIAEGAIQQGVDLVRLGSDTWLNTFAEIGLKRDSDELDWNNENKLSVGAKLRYFGINRTLVSVGAKYDLVNRTKSNRHEDGFTYFVNMHSYWDLADLAGSSTERSLPLGFPGTTWGQLRYPASQFDEETSDTLIEGAIEQGIDWVRPSENSFLNTFVLLDYTFDSKGLEWNNKIKFAPGVKFKVFVAKNALLQIGAMYRWHHRTQSNRTRSDPVFFLNWSTSWDFGDFARKSFGKVE